MNPNAATLPRPMQAPSRQGAPQQQQQMQIVAPDPAPVAAQNNKKGWSLGNMFGIGRSSTNQVQSSFTPPPIPAPVYGKPSPVIAAAMNEDPVDASASAAIAAVAAAAGEEIAPTLSIIGTPEYPQMSIAANADFNVQVRLKYEENEALAAMKTPLDVVCVLDNSGSMGGRKLDSLKMAMDFVVDCMGQKDRLSVVNFNTYPTGLHGLKKMNSDNKQVSKNRMRELRATGGTNILAGMQYGWDVLTGRTTRNPASCMFLLTDGQDRSHREEKLELARAMKEAGTSLFVFGFGTDHDSEHMAAIAAAAEGTFTYIESDDMVVDAFGGTIGTQQGRSLSNITLQMQCPAETDVSIAQLQAGRYTNILQPDGRAGRVSFLNMYMGETRDILLQMRVPAVANAVADYPLVTASASYSLNDGSDSATAATFNVQPVQCCVARVPADALDPNMVRNLDVDVSLNRVLCTAAVAEALRNADAGNFGIAKEVIAAAKAKLAASVSYRNNNSTVTGLMQELDDALLRVRSRGEYEHGGRAMMTEAMATNTYQRSCYTKSGRAAKYQTSSSSAMQERGFRSKGGF